MAEALQTIQVQAKAQHSKRKNPLIVVALQCIPLLAASGCASAGITNQSSSGIALVLWISALFWGLGYLYLGRTYRFLLALVLGPVYAFATFFYSMIGAHFDFEHGRGDPASASAALIQEGLLIGALVLMLTIDALRLAADHNWRESQEQYYKELRITNQGKENNNASNSTS